MKVRVLLYASHRDAVRQKQVEQELTEGATVLDLYQLFAQRYRQLQEGAEVIRFAVNGEYTDSSTVLKDGDEVAFLPPVSGGDGA